MSSEQRKMVGHMDRERNKETQTRREEYTTLLSTIQYNTLHYNAIPLKHVHTVQRLCVQGQGKQESWVLDMS